MPQSPPRALVHAALIGVSILFGVNFVGMKLVLEAVPPLGWALVRVAAAAAILVPLTPRLVRRARLPGRRTLLLLIPASILGVGANQLLFALGLERTTPAHASVIVTCVPVFTLLFAALGRQERITARKLIALGLALAGVLILLEVDVWIGPAGPAGATLDDTLTGDLLTLANMTGYSAFLVIMRHLGRDVPAPVSTAISFVYATVFIALFALPNTDPTELRPLLAPAIWPWALYAVLGASVATYLINVWALRHAQSSQVALYIYLQPVVATTLSMFLGRDAPGTRFFVAAALVFAGVSVSVLSNRRPPPVAAPAGD